MKIRKAKKDDVKSLVKVEMSSGYHKKKFNFEPYLQELFENNCGVFCAEEKGIIVGYITFDNKGEISFLAVTRKMQGRGIANLLLKKIISFAKQNKMKKLFLDVRNDNFPAAILYLKNGFVVTSLHEKKIGRKKIVKLRMERDLA